MQETNLIHNDINSDVINWYTANNVEVQPDHEIRYTHEQRKSRVDNAQRYANGEKYDKDGEKIHRGYRTSRTVRRWRKYKTEEERQHKMWMAACGVVYAKINRNNRW